MDDGPLYWSLELQESSAVSIQLNDRQAIWVREDAIRVKLGGERVGQAVQLLVIQVVQKEVVAGSYLLPCLKAIPKSTQLSAND